jgi:hypothetical protein
MSMINDNYEHLKTKNDASVDVSSSSSSKKSEMPVCRICLDTEEEGQELIDQRDFDLVNGEPQQNKLICPCKCTGSMGMIHNSCLKEWVNAKRLSYKGKKL